MKKTYQLKQAQKKFNLNSHTISKIRRELKNEAEGSIPSKNSINAMPRVIANNIPEDQIIKNMFQYKFMLP
jgi:hypothetical protein